MCHKDGETPFSIYLSEMEPCEESMESTTGHGCSGSDKDVAEVCEGWWLRERGEVGDSEIVKIPKYLSLELTPHLEGEGQSQKDV